MAEILPESSENKVLNLQDVEIVNEIDPSVEEIVIIGNGPPTRIQSGQNAQIGNLEVFAILLVSQDGNMELVLQKESVPFFEQQQLFFSGPEMGTVTLKGESGEAYFSPRF